MFNYAQILNRYKVSVTDQLREPSVKTPEYFNLLVAPEKMRIRGAGWLRSVIVVVFVGLIALFCTAPVPDSKSAYDKPLPMPAGVEQPVPAGK